MKELTEEQKKALEKKVQEVRPEDEAGVREGYAAAAKTAESRGADPKLIDSVKTMWAMLNDPDYTISWSTKAWIIFALGYFVSPIDLIPDFLPGIGYLDDLLVVLWALHQIQDEVVKYRKEKGLAR